MVSKLPDIFMPQQDSLRKALGNFTTVDHVSIFHSDIELPYVLNSEQHWKKSMYVPALWPSHLFVLLILWHACLEMKVY